MFDLLADNSLIVVGAIFGMALLYMIFDFSDYIPHFLLLVYLSLAIFYKVANLERALPLTTIFVIAFGPIILLRSRKVPIIDYWPVALYVLIVIGTSTINGVSMLKNISGFIPVAIALLCAISLPARNAEKRVVLFTYLYIGWIVLNSVFSILQIFVGSEYYLISRTEGYEVGNIRRGYGLVGMATIIGLQFCLGLPLIASMYIGGNGRKTLWNLVLLILGAVGLALTFSRGAILGGIISVALLLWFYRKHKMLAVYLFAGSILLISYDSLMELIPGHISTFFHGKDSSAASRLPLIEVSFRMFAEHPIMGFGYGGFWEYCTRYGSGIHIEAHNTFAQVLVEFGIFGFSLFLTMIFLSLRGYWTYIKRGSSRTLRTHSIGYLCGLFAILVNGIFHAFEWHLIFWLPITFGFMMGYMANEEGRKVSRTEQVNMAASENGLMGNISQVSGLFP